MSYLGDVSATAVFDTKFTTVQNTGAPTTLAGTPVVKVYKNNSTTTETATGITLTVDFDGVTGLNNVRVDVATAGLVAGDNCQLVITTGTINSVSAVGYVVAEFSVSARLEAQASDKRFGIVYGGDVTKTAAGGSTTTITFPANSFATNDTQLVGGLLVAYAGTGAGQRGVILSFDSATEVATLDTTQTTAFDSTTKFVVFAGSLGLTIAQLNAAFLTVDVRKQVGITQLGTGVAGDRFRFA